ARTCHSIFSSSLLLIRRPPRSPPFPYTTLFRSLPVQPRHRLGGVREPAGVGGRLPPDPPVVRQLLGRAGQLLARVLLQHRVQARSEEHTSELQSRENLVCRLLLEKKKKNKNMIK